MKRLTMEYEGKTVSLLPCPFCGGDPLIHRYRRHGVRYSVRCGNEFGHCRMNLRTLDYLELEQAVADWNTRPLEPNEPLTLEELREMDGEPVWVEFPKCPEASGWMLINVNRHCVHNGLLGDCDFENCGNTWLAYRCKPEASPQEGH